MQKKILLTLSTLLMCSGLTFGLAGCQGGEETTSEQNIYTVDTDHKDEYQMDGEGGVGEYLLDFALGSVKTKIEGFVGSAVIDSATWVLKGIGTQMGFEFSNDENYNKIIAQRLVQVDEKIDNLDGKIDWLTESFSDSKYLTYYNNFMTEYRNLNDRINDLWRGFSNIEKEIKDPDSSFTKLELKKMIGQLNASIRNNEKGLSKLHTETNSLANNFIGSSTNTTALNKYSIINIVERFVNKSSPFLENRYFNFNEILAEPLSVLYQAANLTEIGYLYEMSEGGVKSVKYSKDNSIISYVADVNGQDVEYLNCKENDRANFNAKHEDIIKGHEEQYNAIPCKLMANYNVELYQLDDRVKDAKNKYDAVAKLINEFKQDRYGSRSEEINQLYYEDGAIQKTNRFVRSINPSDFMVLHQYHPGQIIVDFRKFGSIKKGEFLKYAKTIERSALQEDENGSAKSLTFRELYEKEGYVFPTNTDTSLLLLGAENNHDITIQNNLMYNPQYMNFFDLMCLDLNSNVAAFNKNPSFVRVTYGLYRHKGQKGWDAIELINNSVANIDSAPRSSHERLRYWTRKPTTYLTIDGLSVNPLNYGTTVPHFEF